MQSDNRSVWSAHYQKEKSKLFVPDENVVRYFSGIFNSSNFSEADWRVLDLGCGSGRHLHFLRNYSTQVYGMDYAAPALESQAGVVCAISEYIPFEGHSFDVVLSWGVLHYMNPESVEKTIQEIYRILKPGGAFFGTIRSSNDTHLMDVLSKGDLKTGQARLFTEEDVSHLLVA